MGIVGAVFYRAIIWVFGTVLGRGVLFAFNSRGYHPEKWVGRMVRRIIPRKSPAVPWIAAGSLGLLLVIGWEIAHVSERLARLWPVMADPSEQKQASIINDAAISTFAELQEKIRKLTEKRPGRALTNEQRATLLAEAKIFRQKMIDDAAANKKHSTTGGVYLWCMRDPEAIHFANQIHDALAPSLLILGDASPVDSDGPNTGVKILLKRLDLKDDAIVELQVVLEKGGIKTEVLPDKILFEGQVVIWVASQPE